MIYRFCHTCRKQVPKYEKHTCKKRTRTDNDKDIKTTKWQKLRLKIIQEDGGICIRCMEKYGIINQDNLTVHHIKSRQNFPSLTFDENNLITLCQTCNNQMGTSDKLDFEFRREERKIIL